MDPNLGSWFPVKFWPPAKPAKYEQCIIVNWLRIELDMTATTRMPILNVICGWRNAEVYWYLKSLPDWTGNIL